MHIVHCTVQKRLWLPVIALLVASLAFGQNVRKESGTINSKKYDGFSITLDNNLEKVSDFWIKELNSHGKLRRKRDFHEIDEFNLGDEYHPEAIFYTRVTERDSASSRIWIALDPGTLLAGEGGEENVNLALEKYVETLPVSFQAYRLQLQIDEAERAAAFTTREQQKLEQDRKNLEYQLEESKAERVRLLQTIERLELEILALTQRIEDNKTAVARSQVDLEKINRMLDQYRQELRKLQ